MFTADEILFKVNDYINNISYNRKPWSLYEPIKYVLSLGGKTNPTDIDASFLQSL